MKKLLTTAALLGIGTAASFATSFELTGNSTGDYTDTSVSNGRAAFETITVGGETISGGDSLDGSLYSWSVSFAISDFNAGANSTGGDSATNQKTLFSVSSASGVGSGYGVIAYESGDYIYYSLTSNAENHDSSPTLIGDPIESSLDQTITISWDAVSSIISLSVGSTTVESDALESAVSLKTYDNSGTIAQSPDTSSVFWTNSGDNPIYGITLSVSEVPEPSMFGLLAGLGAIGLVAARRRRNRKA